MLVVSPFLFIMRKKRILLSGESSLLSTGYGVISKEILSRLYNNYSDRFEVAEMAGYGDHTDQRMKQIPWKVYPVVPHPDDKAYRELYERDPINQFGKAIWEKVTLDYQADINLDHRDFWYKSYQLFSPFRRFYNLVWCPTVDSFPCAEEWIDGFERVDACFTYTEWAQKVLEYQSPGRIKLCGLASPGVNTDIFFPLGNKPKLKQNIGLHPDTLVVGMVARNQIRKLFPHLFEAFSKFLIEGPKHLTCRTILYLHTAWPDLGWDIPQLLKEFGLGNKVMFTYVCRRPDCSTVFSAFWQDSRGICPKCGNPDSSTTNSHAGIPNEALNQIYNLFDVALNLSCAEGLGMMSIESQAAAVPTMVVNYSGMEDLVNRTGAIPINIASFNREVHTGRYMAIPDLNDFIRKLARLLDLPSSIRQSYGFKSREKVKTCFNWDTTVKNLVEVFDTLPLKNWQEPPKFINPAKVNFENMKHATNEQFISWCIVNVLQRPEFLGSYFASRMVRDLNWGHKTQGSSLGFYFTEENALVQKPAFSTFSREDCVKELLKIVDFWNIWERNRCEKFGLI